MSTQESFIANINGAERDALGVVIDYLQAEKADYQTNGGDPNQIGNFVGIIESLFERIAPAATDLFCPRLSPVDVVTRCLQNGQRIGISTANEILETEEERIKDAMFEAADAVICEIVRERLESSPQPAPDEWNYFEVTFKSDNEDYTGECGFGMNPPAHVRAKDEQEIRASLAGWFPNQDVKIVEINPIGK